MGVPILNEHGRQDAAGPGGGRSYDTAHGSVYLRDGHGGGHDLGHLAAHDSALREGHKLVGVLAHEPCDGGLLLFEAHTDAFAHDLQIDAHFGHDGFPIHLSSIQLVQHRRFADGYLFHLTQFKEFLTGRKGMIDHSAQASLIPSTLFTIR